MFVTGLERGLVPISHAKTSDALDEEQRLLYVALSRAERVLHLSWARQRTVGARLANRTPSPWLARVERERGAPEGREPEPEPDDAAADRRRPHRVRDAKGAKAERRDPARELTSPTAALRRARRVAPRLSRASGAPAYVIFHDTTLAAIATARPRTRHELLRLRASAR